MDVLLRIKLPKEHRFCHTKQELIDFLRLDLDGLGIEMDVLSMKLSKKIRFSPTDEQVIDILRMKNEGKESEVEEIPEFDLRKWEPSELPCLSDSRDNDLKWYFFCPRNLKHPKGSCRDRATEGGYWKVQGRPRKINSRKTLIGTKTSLVFHRGRAPNGQRTNWIIHEYCINNSAQDSFVLCRLFDKNENTQYSNGEDIESNESSLTATRSSSLEGTPSDHAMVQETLWPDYKLDHMKCDSLVTQDIQYNNNYMASLVGNHEAEMMTTDEVHFSNAPTLETDPKISSPLPFDMHSGEGNSYSDNSAIAFISNGLQIQDGIDEYNSSFEQFLDGVIIVDAEEAQQQMKENPSINSEGLLSSSSPSNIHTGKQYSYPNNSAIAFNNGLQIQDATDEYNSSSKQFLDGVIIVDAKETQQQVKVKPSINSEELLSSPLPSNIHTGEQYSYPNSPAIAFDNGLQIQDATDEDDSSFKQFLDGLISDLDVEEMQGEVKVKPLINSEELLSSPLPSSIHTGEQYFYPGNSAIASNNGWQVQDTIDDCDSSNYIIWTNLLNEIDTQVEEEQVKAKPATESEGLLSSTSPCPTPWESNNC